MRITKYKFKILLVVMLLIGIVTTTTGKVSFADQSSSIIVNYFYISDCERCKEDKELIDQITQSCASILSKENKIVVVNKYDIFEIKNIGLLEKYYKQYNVLKADQNVPLVFVGKTYLKGKTDILANLKKTILNTSQKDNVDISQETIDSAQKSIESKFEKFKLLGAIVVGFINGLTPCSLSMLLFFISLILAKNVSVIKMGFAYCIAKFITYFLLGTVLFKTLATINLSWTSYVIKILMLIILGVFVIFNINDYFAAKNEKYEKIKLQLPRKLRKYNHDWIKNIKKVDSEKLLILFSILLGFITSIGEFLCTGQIYLTTILYVLNKETIFNIKALLFFIVYNLAFISPSIILTLILYKGKELFEVSELLRDKMKIIKLINTIIFIVFALLIIFN